MDNPVSYTALVLAGTRPGGDPLATYAGVSHKALIEVGGRAMLERVLLALAGAQCVKRIVVAIDRADVLAGFAAVDKEVTVMAAASGPSASVAAALAREGTPLLVTTADHALLESAWVDEFVAAAALDVDADAFIGLARSEAVLAAAPNTQRTWLRFPDGAYSGCNLFLLRTPAALNIVRFWQQLEAERKKPLSLLRRLGLSYVLRYRFGWLGLGQALARLGKLGGARIAPVMLTDGRAAIDVDKPADLILVRELVANPPRAPAAKA
ncbi:MAG: nucleotidyltransferase family protein [Pseudomonadota bacterium]